MLKRFLAIAAIIAATVILTGCGISVSPNEGPLTGPAAGWIDKPSALEHIQHNELSNPDNMTRRTPGWTENSQVLFDTYEELTGAAFTFEIHNQWSYFFGIKDIWIELFTHWSILEFQFPETAYAGILDWVAHLHLDCSISLASLLDDRSYISFEYIVFEDYAGIYSLESMSDDQLIEALTPGWETEGTYVFAQTPYHKLTVTDERRGRMNVNPGNGAKLFLGISVQMYARFRDNILQVGVKPEGEGADFCMFEVRNSGTTGSLTWYGPEYTIGPVE